MSRLALEPGILEKKAALAVSETAEEIQQLCYYLECYGVPPATVRALHKAYRVFKDAVDFYGGDNPLVWTAPEFKFRPKGDRC